MTHTRITLMAVTALAIVGITLAVTIPTFESNDILYCDAGYTANATLTACVPLS